MFRLFLFILVFASNLASAMAWDEFEIDDAPCFDERHPAEKVIQHHRLGATGILDPDPTKRYIQKFRDFPRLQPLSKEIPPETSLLHARMQETVIYEGDVSIYTTGVRECVVLIIYHPQKKKTYFRHIYSRDSFKSYNKNREGLLNVIKRDFLSDEIDPRECHVYLLSSYAGSHHFDRLREVVDAGFPITALFYNDIYEHLGGRCLHFVSQEEWSYFGELDKVKQRRSLGVLFHTPSGRLFIDQKVWAPKKGSQREEFTMKLDLQ
jgi:hypothetical protein